MQFQQKAKSFGIIEGYTEVTPAPERGGSVEGVSDHRGPVAAYFEFDSKEHAEVVLAAGSSFVSRDKAEENMWMELSEMERVRGEGFGSGGKDMKGGNSSAGVSTEGIGSSTGGGVFNLQRVEARVTQQWEDALSVVQVADDAQVSLYPRAGGGKRNRGKRNACMLNLFVVDMTLVEAIVNILAFLLIFSLEIFI